MPSYITFRKSDVEALLLRIQGIRHHHFDILDPEEYEFLLQMEDFLRMKRRPSLPFPRLEQLIAIFEKLKDVEPN